MIAPGAIRGEPYRTSGDRPSLTGGASPDSCARVMLAVVLDDQPLPSSFREIAAKTGLTLTEVADTVHALEAEGLVSHEPRQARTLRPLVAVVAR